MGGSGCKECEPRLRGLLDGELGPAETDRVRSHLSGCAFCRAVLAATAEVSHLVGGLQAEIEPPPHFEANLQVRLAALRAPARRPRWSRRYSLAGATVAGTVMALILGAPPRIGAQDLVGRVQESWSRLQSYSCRFVAEGVVSGSPRRFEQQQWFRKPNLFRLETNQYYPQTTYLEADRVTTYIPGADWQGKRVAITRPRRAREEGLPFPFGAEWPASYDVTMEGLVRELRAQQDGQLLGTEEVLGQLCHVLKFRTRRPGDGRTTHYLVWVDRESFLPLKFKIYLNNDNHTISEAVDLQTNVTVPADLFRYRPAPDTFRVYGEAEPFVFALRPVPPRPESFDRSPVDAARSEIRARAADLPFPLLAPGNLPQGHVLVRVRRKKDCWLDAYWLHPTTGAVLKLLEQPAGWKIPQEARGGIEIPLDGPAAAGEPGSRQYIALWHEVRRPSPIQYLNWKQDGTRLILAAAGVERDEAVRIAASMEPVGAPVPVAGE
jgi:outer membrane lipoprotein-sorting protein